MIKFAIVLSIMLFATNVFAREVTQIVFEQLSSAVTSAPNLRIQVTPATVTRDRNSVPVVGSTIAPGMTYNYYLTKSVTFPVTDSMIAIEVQSDSDITMKVNSESAYMKVYGDCPVSKVLK